MQFRHQFNQSTAAAFARDPLQQGLYRRGANFVFRQLHCRQPRSKAAQPGVIVKTGQPKIVGAPQTYFIRCLHQSHGHQIIGYEDRIRPPRQQEESRSVPRIDVIIAFCYQILLVLQASGLQSLAFRC